MASKPNKLVLAQFNPGGHWALLAINAYDETVYYLDSLQTTSILFVGIKAITIFRSQKNIQTSRKQPKWKTMKCPLQVGVVECRYYVMRDMRDIITNGSIVVTDLIDTRTSYSQVELDENNLTYQALKGARTTWFAFDTINLLHKFRIRDSCVFPEEIRDGCTKVYCTFSFEPRTNEYK
uniref:Ubiquitin-like protease family profile domain-containing protein n=1 Tax=Cucumis melo TaxID=3656 RepID=A0A9I9EBF6_CUCME